MLSLNDFRDYVHFLNDFSLFVWVYPLWLKSDVAATFTLFLNLIKTQFGAHIKFLPSDNGGKYKRVIKGAISWEFN